jgi:hypothetical protein
MERAVAPQNSPTLVGRRVKNQFQQPTQLLFAKDIAVSEVWGVLHDVYGVHRGV